MASKITNPRTKKALISWLVEQPQHRKYVYMDKDNCLGAQYCRAHGLHYFIPDMENENRVPRKRESFAVKLEWVAQADARTFGAALKRARQLPE
jgi:ferredoxin